MAVRRVTWCGVEQEHPAHTQDAWDGWYCPGRFCEVEGCEGSPTHIGRHGGVRSLRDDPLAGWATRGNATTEAAVNALRSEMQGVLDGALGYENEQYPTLAYELAEAAVAFLDAFRTGGSPSRCCPDCHHPPLAPESTRP
jgi:hypothetical protein